MPLNSHENSEEYCLGHDVQRRVGLSRILRLRKVGEFDDAGEKMGKVGVRTRKPSVALDADRHIAYGGQNPNQRDIRKILAGFRHRTETMGGIEQFERQRRARIER